MDTTSEFICAFAEYTPYVFGCISQLLLALMALDRFITIVFANRFLMFRKKDFQLSLVCLVFIYGICIYIPIPISQKLEINVINNTQTNQTMEMRYCMIVDQDKFNL